VGVGQELDRMRRGGLVRGGELMSMSCSIGVWGLIGGDSSSSESRCRKRCAGWGGTWVVSFGTVGGGGGELAGILVPRLRRCLRFAISVVLTHLTRGRVAVDRCLLIGPGRSESNRRVWVARDSLPDVERHGRSAMPRFTRAAVRTPIGLSPWEVDRPE
jgi:hypothetical protein